ncbi:hypothetical protein RFI_38888, partial [Reticulomyxa filosa]
IWNERKRKKKKQKCRSMVLKIYGLFQWTYQVKQADSVNEDDRCNQSPKGADMYHQDYDLLFIKTKLKWQSITTCNLTHTTFTQAINMHNLSKYQCMETFPIYNWYDFRVDLMEDIKVVVYCNLIAKGSLLLSSKKIGRK